MLNLDGLQIKELYSQGLSARQVGSKMGCSQPAILKRLRKMNCAIRPQKKPKTKATDLTLVKHLYLDEKLSCGEIAEQFSCDDGTILKHRLVWEESQLLILEVNMIR